MLKAKIVNSVNFTINHFTLLQIPSCSNKVDFLKVSIARNT